MRGFMRYLVWCYPEEDGSAGEVKVTEAEAIKLQREHARKYGFEYKTDQDALDDYICVNWAFWREEL